MSYNKSILEGHLSRDIELKYTQGGSAIGNTAIAVNRKYKTSTGEQKEEVMFIDLTFFGRTAEIANQYLRKGSHVLVDGYIKLDQWTAQDGSKRSRHSVTVENLTMLGSAQQDHSGGQATHQNNVDDPNRHNVSGHMNRPTADQYASDQSGPNRGSQGGLPDIDINDEEIPF